MCAIGVERCSITAQAVGDPEAAAFELLEARLAHRLEGAAAVGFTHHRLQAQQAGVEITAELVGHHHRRSALGVDVVVLAVPEQLVEVPSRLLEPTAELPLLRCGVEPGAELQLLGDGQGCLKGGNPERPAVGADALERPVIEGLIGSPPVVGKAIAIGIKGFEIAQGFHGGRPAVGEEAHVFSIGRELEGAPDLQHVVAGQIFPEVAVLVGGVVGGIPRALIRSTQVMGGGPLHLAGCLDTAFALGEIPTDRPWGGVGGGNGPGEAAQHRLVELRPELQQGQGAIEPHIQAFVPGVVEALEHAEAPHRIVGRGRAPEAAAAAEVVELVEESHPQRFGQVTALEHRLLPGLDLIAPLPPLAQTFSGDGRGIASSGSEEIGVAPQGTGAGGKRRDRQVPADHQRDLNALSGFQMALHRQGCTGGIGGPAAAVVVAVGNRSVAAEAAPEVSAIAVGVPAAAALDAHAGLLGGGDAPLALAFAHRAGDIASENDSTEVAIVDPIVAMPLALADGRGVVVLRAAVVSEVNLGGGVGVGEPAAGVAPAQHQGEIEGLAAGIAQGPDEHRQGVAGALVVAGENRAEGLAAHLGIENALVVRPAQGIAGGVGACAAFGGAGGIPAPAGEGLSCVRSGVIPLGFHR